MPTALPGRWNNPMPDPASDPVPLRGALQARAPSAIELEKAIASVFADGTGEHFAIIDTEGHLTPSREGRAPQHLITIRGTREVFFSPDSRWIANAGEENTARVWELAAGTERLAISDRVNRVEFSQDGNRMVTHGSENWVTT